MTQQAAAETHPCPPPQRHSAGLAAVGTGTPAET